MRTSLGPVPTRSSNVSGAEASTGSTRPERGLVDGWIERAMELVEPGSASHVMALVAKSYWHAEYEGAVAREASVLAERLGDPELRSYAWMARAAAAFNRGEYGEAFNW